MGAPVKFALHATTKLSPNGRIVIPIAIREALGLKPGESVVMDIEDGILRIESYHARIRRIQEEFAHFAPQGRSASDELIAERRQEALLEQETFERARELRRIRDGYQSPENHQAQTPASPVEKPDGRVA
jgi:AbrB family looped-hinge helix DNA binding protein